MMDSSLRMSLLFFLSCLFLQQQQPAAAEPRRKHGQACPANDWCDYGKWLWCHEETATCGCLHPKRQVFDSVHNRCVAVVGTECNVYIGDRDCAANSFCDWRDGKGRCKCKAGYSPTEKRTCSNGIDPPLLPPVSNELAEENEVVQERKIVPKPNRPASGFLFQPRADSFSKGVNQARIDPAEGWRRFWSLIMANNRNRVFFR